MTNQSRTDVGPKIRTRIETIRKNKDELLDRDPYLDSERRQFRTLTESAERIADSCEDAALLYLGMYEKLCRTDSSDGMDGHGLYDELELLERFQDFIGQGFGKVWDMYGSYIIEALDPTVSLCGFDNLVGCAIFIRRRIEDGDGCASACYNRMLEAWSGKNPDVASQTRTILDGLDLSLDAEDQDYDRPGW